MNPNYRDPDQTRTQNSMVICALRKLARMNVAINAIRYRASNPKIEVVACPSLRKLDSADTGRGWDAELGRRYFTRAAVLSGCHVEWKIYR